MKYTKKISMFFVSLLLIVNFSASAFATAITEETVYIIDDIALEMVLPEGTYVFTDETSADDPMWAEAGIEDVDYVMDEFEDLYPHALITANDGETRIYIMSTETDATEGYYNLSYMDEEDLIALATQYNFNDDVGFGTSSLYETDHIPFIELTMEITASDGVYYYEYDFYTIVNGYSVTFCQAGTEAITEDSIEYAKELIDNLTFYDTYLSTDGMTNEEIRAAYIAFFVIVILIIAIIIFFIHLSSKNKHNKEFGVKLAKNLSEFRKLREDNPPMLGDVLFENTTEVSDDAIKAYAQFLCYIDKRIATIFMYLLWVSAIIIMAVTGSQWWILAILVGAMGFTLYKHFTSGSTLEKSLKKSYKKIRVRTATFRFYQNEFSISGIEPGNFHPYFQITDLKESTQYIYFFFGANNVYMLDKSNFTNGEVNDFKQFISGKSGINLK